MLKKDYPELAKHWNYKRNNKNGIYFEDIAPNSGKKVWWKCEKGHEWEAMPHNISLGEGCPYCSGRRAIEGVNDLATLNPALASEWNYKKNDGLTPKDVTPGSGKKVWWKCKNGHEWQAATVDRKRNGCPICSNRKVLPGFNDLATEKPQLASEWNYEKNRNISPEDIRPGSNKKVWWKCEKGHEWEAVVASRSAGVGCPYCSNKKVLPGFNDIATTNPELLKEWDYDRNTLSPTEICGGSHKKMWWKCSECGYEWKTVVKLRTRKDGKATGCPKCANIKRIQTNSNPIIGENDLESQHPEVLDEWDYEKNTDVKPSQLHKGTHRKVWWKCIYCGKSYLAPVCDKVNRKPGCPDCSAKRTGDINATPTIGVNDLKTLYPRLLDEWDYDKNQQPPELYMAKSNKKVYWKCEYGHCWSASIVNRVKGRGCPVCSKERRISFPEKAIFYYIKENFEDSVENYKNEGLHGREIDIYIPSLKVGIEYDGYLWHRDKKKDLLKDKLCHKLGIKLIRVREDGLPVLKNTTSIAFETIPDDSYINLEKTIAELLDYLNRPNADVNITRDGSGILDLMRLTRKKNSILEAMPGIAERWDYEKNGNLTPDMFSKSSEKYVWVKCTECGKSYRTRISNIYHEKTTKCRECSFSKYKKGINDFKTRYPKLAEEYDYQKNQIKLEDLKLDERKNKFHWKCRKCGYTWQASIAARIISDYCPRCAVTIGAKTRTLNRIKKNGSLATNYFDLTKEWHPNKNGDLKPEEVTCGNKKIVWWKCTECGNEWQASIALRTKGFGKCPYCTGKKRGEK